MIQIFYIFHSDLKFSSSEQEDSPFHRETKNFTYAKLATMTENFKTTIGSGGFGKVYLGTQKNGSQVAVKLLSSTSTQGPKEFQNEVRIRNIDLLLNIHSTQS